MKTDYKKEVEEILDRLLTASYWSDRISQGTAQKRFLALISKAQEEEKTKTIDSLNKTFMGITLAVVMFNGKATGDSMIKSWEQALDSLKKEEGK